MDLYISCCYGSLQNEPVRGLFNGDCRVNVSTVVLPPAVNRTADSPKPIKTSRQQRHQVIAYSAPIVPADDLITDSIIGNRRR